MIALQNDTQAPALLTKEEVSARWRRRVAPSTVRKMVRDGRLKGVKIGVTVMVTLDSVIAYESREVEADKKV